MQPVYSYQQTSPFKKRDDVSELQFARRNVCF